jgi:hypothetical protein
MSVLKIPSKGKVELDLDSLRLSPEHVAVIAEAQKRHKKPRPARGKDFLYEDMPRLAIGLNAGGGIVWAYLLQQARIKGREAIPLPSLALSKLGVSRRAKARALDKLEAKGLITVERCRGRLPRVTVLI